MEITLKSQFEKAVPHISESLNSRVLPKDSTFIQDTIQTFLDNLFDEKGEYRKSLTHSEDYIFQASVNLLNSQRMMYGSFFQYPDKSCNPQRKESSNPIKKLLYFLKSILDKAISDGNAEEETNIRFDYESFLVFVGSICESLDDIMETYRVQTHRIHNFYESQKKPSFTEEYSTLVTNLENLFNIANEEDCDLEDILSHIDLVKRSLKNYGVIYENGSLTSKSMK